MTTPTIAVTCTANDQNGNPVAGAVFTARLDSTEVYQGFVVPERVQAVANATGIAVLNLWPNALGVAGSLYRVTAVNPDTGRKFLDTTISVPNAPCNLHEILVQAPYPTLDAAAQALVAAQGALAEVTALVFDAADSRAAAAASEAAAEADRVAALGSQLAATNSAAEAAYSAGRIDLGALDNAVTVSTAQAVSATASAVEATTQRNAASVSAAAALASQGVTTTKAAEGATSAAAALASENTATTQAGIATTGATTATTQADIATTQAMSATTSKNAAATSATDASTSAGTATTKAGEASTSATAAAASATTATTQADLASGHATAAGTSAGTATTQATASAASAATSLAQANISTTKAGEAAASATASDTARAASVVAMDAAVVAKTAAETANGTAQTAATTATTQAGISTTGATAATTAKDLAQAAQAAAEAARDGATAVMSGVAGGVLSGTYPNPGFAVDMATQGELNAHMADVANSHAVTKAQVGLGNADNTSDAAKPVSTAAQTALNLKVDKTGGTMTGDLSVPSLNGGPLAGTRNKIINGKMEIAQRGLAFPASASGAYTLDRWTLGNNNTTGVTTISRENDGPSGSAFQFSVRHAVTTADVVIDAAQNYTFNQRIEGYNVRDLILQTFTLSFWVKSSKTGVHCVSLLNSAADRSYVAEFTVLAANTWEKKSIVVTDGIPVSGTWNFAEGLGLNVRWCLAAGANFITTANAWNVGHFSSTANQVNCLDTVGNIFAITGVQLEPGTVATPFEARPYGLELMLCQRYGARFTGTLSTQLAPVTPFYPFPVPMRASPTISLVSVSSGSGGAVGALNDMAGFQTAVNTGISGFIAFASAEL